ncbi:MAG TPA: DUF2157 domain-containing protein [Micavibrio sp.]|nr:DUF2157 domain-containing protein [Micavibrio sp.]
MAMAIKHKKLKEWIAAGLISAAQVESIHAYEEDRKGGRFGRGLVGLSVFAILVGVLSIVAANWNEIPGGVKISVHALLNAAVGFFAVRACGKGKAVWSEGGAVAFLGLSFTLIILIGQVFQLTGSVADALMFWIVITLPFFLLITRSYMTAVPWMLAFLATICVVLSDKIELLPDSYRSPFAAGLGAFLPLALMADGAVEFFRRHRSVLAEVSLKAGLVLSALLASASMAMWPANQFGYLREKLLSVPGGLSILAVGVAAISAHAVLHGFYRAKPEMRHAARFAFLGLFAFVAPLMIPLGHGHIAPALVFIAYWAALGWLAQSMQHMRIVSVAIAVIAFRIFMIYVEVFGSLMDTGLGLICGGGVMLALIYAARRVNKRLRGKVAA